MIGNEGCILTTSETISSIMLLISEKIRTGKEKGRFLQLNADETEAADSKLCLVKNAL